MLWASARLRLLQQPQQQFFLHVSSFSNELTAVFSGHCYDCFSLFFSFSSTATTTTNAWKPNESKNARFWMWVCVQYCVARSSRLCVLTERFDYTLCSAFVLNFVYSHLFWIRLFIQHSMVINTWLIIVFCILATHLGGQWVSRASTFDDYVLFIFIFFARLK